jgi:hypothetical protein
MFFGHPDPDPLARGRYGSGSFYHEAKEKLLLCLFIFEK